jgi:hypothetical protein
MYVLGREGKRTNHEAVVTKHCHTTDEHGYEEPGCSRTSQTGKGREPIRYSGS